MVQQLNIFSDSNPTESGEHTFHTHLHESNHAEQDWKSLRPYFGWQSEQVIQETYKVTSRLGGTTPHHDYLKNISNQEILFSISPGVMSLLPQTPSSVTHLLSMMEVPWHDSLVARILWYVMHMGSKVRNNSSTHFMMASSPEEL